MENKKYYPSALKVKDDKILNKLYSNALITERLNKISKEERQIIILKLLETRTHRELSEEIGIHHSTINDWKTLRQNNKEEGIHLSLSLIYRKISNLNPENITDWGRIEQIKEKCEELLRQRVK